ncbi:MAG: arginine--tRNA ligase [Pirellulaceae bacterium]
MNLLSEIRNRFNGPLSDITPKPEEFLGMVRPAQDARHGDYQANFAMPLSKPAGKPARELAEELISHADLDDLCESVEVAGPGFINLKIRDDIILEGLQKAFVSERLDVDTLVPAKTIVIDFSSPNVAKPMHVGHIRSTLIGDSLSRIARFLGHQVITDNHLGDWGTQFGMIIYGYKHFLNDEAYRASPVEHWDNCTVSSANR